MPGTYFMQAFQAAIFSMYPVTKAELVERMLLIKNKNQPMIMANVPRGHAGSGIKEWWALPENSGDAKYSYCMAY